MTNRDEYAGGGGMTGATGDLTPADEDRAFGPGERREMEDPAHQADMTSAQGRRAPAQQGETGDVGELPEGGPTNMAVRDDGYGSSHGLSPDDPAYRMERHFQPARDPRTPADADADREPGETRIGGDEVIEGDERF